MVERMGFVQLDAINVVERAHHLTLGARFDGYRREHLDDLLQRSPRLFEHWTHDASAIPIAWFGPWRRRARRMVARPRVLRWLKERLGPEPARTLRQVKGRIRREGPKMSRDFAAPDGHGRSAWWGWKPSKAALEFLWWRGDLSVARRVHFHKVYDLTERHLPHLAGCRVPDERAYVAWACREAMTRLVVATPKEVCDFHMAVSKAEAASWCAAQTAQGALRGVVVEGGDGSESRDAFALPDWRRRARRAEDALGALDDRMCLLAPFDPVLRDRARAQRLFAFAYRFEAFVPAAKRRHGYYVLPVLRGEHLVARVDAKHLRREDTLAILGVWWERGKGRTKKERSLLEAAAERLARQVGAARVRFPPAR